MKQMTASKTGELIPAPLDSDRPSRFVAIAILLAIIIVINSIGYWTAVNNNINKELEIYKASPYDERHHK